ncbi:AAA family ATPase [Rhizobium rhizogenes]|uniref:AAA family ATPase n=1 Tax=Rhizobium rhizogenes TaxID=359 RepID=UPI0015725466|nr:AAA family ATPase [Rhizobium rhizogenes]NTF53255.1 ATP-binding protein [Rhizobium rhizogenes]NTH10480.1 ATP-binding protein [Rhizobium rhizogenes]
MKLLKARITDYRSVKDSGWIDFEQSKTILVGPNEAGKSAILRALQQINAPSATPSFDALRDYPRKDYNDITTNKTDPSKTDVVVAHFTLDEDDIKAIDEEFRAVTYVFGRRLDNSWWHDLEAAPPKPTTESIAKDLQRLAAHIDGRQKEEDEKSSKLLEVALSKWAHANHWLQGDISATVIAWLTTHYPLVDEEDEKEEARYDKILKLAKSDAKRKAALAHLQKSVPVFCQYRSNTPQ